MKIVETGDWPAELKIDHIHFLWKRKGSKAEAGNYRPITIAPAIGKIVEKVAADYLKALPDPNPWNHAYIRKRSCQSAVIEAIKYYEDFSREAKAINEGDSHNAAVFILCEDISSAFESIDCEVINGFITPLIDSRSKIKLPELLMSYLERECFIVEGFQKIQLKKPYVHRSFPQGSILSPLAWRIFDGHFSALYVNAVNKLKAGCPLIRRTFEIAYADDHCQIVLFKWKRVNGETINGTAPAKIGKLVKTFRALLDDSTKSLGCGINPDKSEIISDIGIEGFDWYDPAEKIKTKYKWLGYGLEVNDGKLLFDDDFFAQKEQVIREYIADIFQYAPTLSTKIRIFKVYIAPILEYFLPSIIRSNINQTNRMEKFQHEILCKTLEIPRTASITKVLQILKISSISEKLEKACLRYRTYIGPTSQADSPSTNPRTTRSGRQLGVKLETGIFTDRIHMIAQNAELRPKTKFTKFSAAYAAKWAATQRQSISNRIAAANS